MPILGLTKLGAVNAILETVNDLPFTVIDSTGTWPNLTYGASIAGRAEQILDRVSQDVQSRGFQANLAISKPFTPAGSPLKVTLPVDTLSVRGAGPDHFRNFELRGDFLYDLDRHTDQFATAAVIHLDVVTELEFTVCPPRLKQLIVAEAAVVFQRRHRGSLEQDAMLGQERNAAEVKVDRPKPRPNTDPVNPFPLMPSPAMQRGERGGG